MTSPGSKVITYTYTNVIGQSFEMIDPDEGVTTYLYDAAGRQNQIINPRDKVTTLTFDTASRPVSKLTHCTLTTTTYDPAGNTLSIHATKDSGSSPVSLLTYTYDNTNHRLAQVDQDGILTTWTYDAAYQLRHEHTAEGEFPVNIAHIYDPAGNRTVKIEGDIATTFTFDPANQMLTRHDADGWTTFTYDSRGNQTAQESPAGDTFTTYDAANQATLVETPSATVEMTYNAMYQRVQKAVDGGQTKRFIYDHKRLLAETDETDTTTRSFTSGTAGPNSEYGDLVSEYDAQSLEEVFPQYDAQWSTRELVSDTGDIVARFRNTAFGLASPASSPNWSDLSSAQWSVMSVEDWNHLPVMDSGGPFGFGGQSGYYFDPETNLYLLGGGGRGRYYDPQLARFQNADPSGIASGDPNLYRYVANDPVNRRDPSGNQDPEEYIRSFIVKTLGFNIYSSSPEVGLVKSTTADLNRFIHDPPIETDVDGNVLRVPLPFEYPPGGYIGGALSEGTGRLYTPPLRSEIGQRGAILGGRQVPFFSPFNRLLHATEADQQTFASRLEAAGELVFDFGTAAVPGRPPMLPRRVLSSTARQSKTFSELVDQTADLNCKIVNQRNLSTANISVTPELATSSPSYIAKSKLPDPVTQTFANDLPVKNSSVRVNALDGDELYKFLNKQTKTEETVDKLRGASNNSFEVDAPDNVVLQSFAKQSTEMGNPLSLDEVISGLRRTTKQADEIADAIESGQIRVEFVDDNLFERAYRIFHSKGDLPHAFQVFDDLVYVRKSSPTPLSDIVHEGTHVLQRMKGFKGTKLVAEIQAHLHERFFRRALGLHSKFSSESLEAFIKRAYEDFADILNFSKK